jgi:hypothetical protein
LPDGVLAGREAGDEIRFLLTGERRGQRFAGADVPYWLFDPQKKVYLFQKSVQQFYHTAPPFAGSYLKNL